MNDEERLRLREVPFIESRVPALDALSTFVPDGQESDPALANLGSSRWYPVEGGHRMLVLYQGGEYDTARFTIEKGAWDHEHCKTCQARIEAMTLRWVTESGPYITLCNECHKELNLA